MLREPSVAVIGGGISGLSCAYRLRQKGLDVTLFEASHRVGGVIGTENSPDGYLLESGPHTLLDKHGTVSELVQELNVEHELTGLSAQARSRYVVKDGRLVALPTGPKAFIKSPLLSTSAKLRLLTEPAIPRSDADIDESLANFIIRRLGPEVLDYLVDPFVAGTFAGDPRHLSARHAFPTLVTLESDYRSLFLGALFKLAGTPRGTKQARTKIVSFRRGMQTLVDAFASQLGDAIQLNSPVRSVHRHDDHWKVRYKKNTRTASKKFDAVLFCMPAHQLGKLQIQDQTGQRLDSEIFDSFLYSPVAVVSMGFDHQDVEHSLSGLGFLVPRLENFHILGTFFNSTMFSGRAPRNHVQLTSFIGGARQPELVFQDEDTLLELVRIDLQRLLGIRTAPSFVNIRRYERAIPQYEVGYASKLAALSDLEHRYKGLFFAGNYRDGISVPAVIEAAIAHASRIDSYIAVENALAEGLANEPIRTGEAQ